MSTLAHAIELSQALATTPHPRVCPLCFIILALGLRAGQFSQQRTPLLEKLRNDHPEFWDTCLSFLTTVRTEDDFPALRNQLRRNLVRCPDRISHRKIREDTLTDPIHILVEALYMVLLACIGFGAHPTVQGIKALKAFGKRGRWPESADKLFPFGSQNTIDMHVFWCSQRFSVAPLEFLGQTLHLARPHTLPHLVSSKVTRSKFVYVLAQMLQADLSRVPDVWEGEPPVTPACDGNLPLASYTRESLIEAVLGFTRALVIGLDARHLDYRPLFLDYGRVMAKAAEAASYVLNTSSSDFPLLSTFAYVCHTTYRIPFDSVPMRLRSAWPQAVPDADEPAPRTMMVWQCLVQLSRTRSCSRPGCTQTVHVNGGRPLSQCAACRTTRYCGKDCQLCHWKHVKEPHKTVCPILRRLCEGGSPGMPLKQFAVAFDGKLAEDERESLVQWTRTMATFQDPYQPTTITPAPTAVG